MTPSSALDTPAGPAAAHAMQALASAAAAEKSVHLQLELSIPDLKLSDYECEAFTAEEGVSRLFRLEAAFVIMKDLTGASVTGKPAWFRVRQHGQKQEFAGVVLEFRLLNKIDVNSYTYAVVIGPRLALLDRTRQSAIFSSDGALGLTDLLKGLLSGDLYKGATVQDRGVTLDYDVQDLELKDYRRPNITKYNESDFQFFSRICEHYGVFYFFEPFTAAGMVKDRLVVAAKNSAFVLAPTSPWDYSPVTTTVGVTQAAVTSLEWVARPPLKTFKLRDFSEAKPDTDMLISSTESRSDGVGTVVEYGDHFLTRDEGEEMVEIRAQEEAWQASVYRFESTRCELHAGQVFTLKGHAVSSFNTEYIVIEARHEAGKRGALGYGANYANAPYSNSFTAIRKSQPFRPRRVTPRPVMAGVFNAVVEAEDTSTTRAAVDGSGRYTIGFGYNEMASRNTSGKGTAPIRQAQPYAGSSADSVVGGMHFPLVRNTEVLVGYVNGDPDRPVILGAAFNQNNVDLAPSSGQTANRIRSTGGLLMEMEDGANASAAARYIRLDVPKAVTNPTPGGDPKAKGPLGTYLRLGGDAADNAAGSGLTYSSSTVANETQANKNEDDPYGDKASSSKTATSMSVVSATDHSASGRGVLLYSDGDLNINMEGAALMLFGSGYTSKTAQGDSRHTVDNGQYTLHAKNGMTIEAGVGGSADILIHATNTVTTKSDGDTYDWIYGNSTKKTWGNSFTVFVGTEESIKMAVSFSFQLGVALSIMVGGKIDILSPVSVKITTHDIKVVITDFQVINRAFKVEANKSVAGDSFLKVARQAWASTLLCSAYVGINNAKAAYDARQAAAKAERAALESQNVSVSSRMSSIESHA